MRIAHSLALASTVTLLACGGPKAPAEPAYEATVTKEPARVEAPAAATTEPPTRATPTYDKESIEVVLKRAARQVQSNCGAAKGTSGKATGPWGKVTIAVKLGHTGRSQGTVIPAPFEGTPAGKCVERAFANLIFPPWGGTDETVEWEVELVEPPAPAAPTK